MNSPIRLVRGVTAVTLVATLAACSAIRFGGGPEYDVAGTWEGSVSVQGERIPGTLSLAQDGAILDAAFVAPDFGLNADGEGEIDDEGVISIELAYDLQCPGIARLQGTVDEDVTRMSGTLEATDCTGTIDGAWRFTR